MRGDLLAALDDELCGLDQRRAANMTEREPPVPPPKIMRSLSPSTSADAIERNAELVAQYLRIGGGVALAEIERAGDDGHRAVGLEVDGAQFLVIAAGGHFEIAADAEAAQHARASCSRACAA